MATILKHDSGSDPDATAPRPSGLAGFNLNDLAAEGRARMEACQQQIRELLEEARRDADRIRQQSHEQGYRDGLAEAAIESERKLREQAEDLSRDRLELIRQSAQRLRDAYQEWMEQYSHSLTGIALAAAERIVRRRLQDEPALLLRWADDALASTRAAQQLTLAVHPETLAQLGSALDELLASPNLPEQTQVQADESVEPGSVVVRQLGGEIDAGLTAQLGRIEELLS